MMALLMALVGVIATTITFYEGMRAERSRVLRIIDKFHHQATHDQQEALATASRAIRRRVEDPITFK